MVGKEAPTPSDHRAKAIDPAPPATKATSADLSRFLWPVLCLFQFGLILGGIWYGRHSTNTSQEERGVTDRLAASVAETVKQLDATPLATPPVGETGRADDFVREGRYEAALAIYESLAANATGSMRDALAYRIALCQEGMGRWDQAIGTFRTIISRSDVVPMTAAAQLGQARTWMRMKRPVEAKVLLYDLLLHSSRPGLRQQMIGDGPHFETPPQPLLADVRYLLALALTLESLPLTRPGPLNEALAPHTAADWKVERVLECANPLKEGTAALPREDALTVQRLRPGAEDLMVSASLPQTPISGLLDHLAERAGLHVQWSPDAEHQAAGRSSTLLFDNLPLPDVLRGLLDPLGLVWRIEGEVLRIMAEPEADRETLHEYRLTVARRSLRDAILAHPGHPLTASAWLELGDLEITAGRLPDGIGWYERLRREQPRSPVVIEALYNLGMTQRRLGDWNAARMAFYQVVDRAPGHELTPLAYLRVGQMYLEEQKPLDAARVLNRATASGAGSPAKPAAVVTLAAAHLMNRNPRAASSAILENRAAVLREPYRSVAGFLDSLARYRAFTDHKEQQREASILLSATLAAQESRVLGVVGKLLIGQAYREMGMNDQMIQVYEKALPEARGPLAAEMAFTLAEGLLADNKHEEGVRRLTQLADSKDPAWAARARFLLAQIALDASQPQDCLHWCRDLLKDQEHIDIKAVLKLMGHAHEQRGDHARAAQFFQGRWASDE